MNHSELVAAVAEQAGSTKAEASKFVDAMFETIRATLVKGDEVKIAGFGSFSVGTRPAREGRNPRTGETMQLPESKAAKFSPAKAVKDALNG